jgi:peptide/nickel transport system substrate-binding protein
MKQIVFPFRALISLALLSLVPAAVAATRPHYGGTLRVAMQSAPTTLDLPASATPTDYFDMARLLSLIGDNLVKVDAQDRPQPGLAVSWQSDSTARHWQFTLRPGAKFHDGTSASAGMIAQIVVTLHPDWNARAALDILTIDTDISTPNLLAELALPRNLILNRTAAGLPVGTGPFRVADFQPGKNLKLVASEDAWSGRPYLDAIEIEFGKSLRDQAVALDLARADVIEAAPQPANSSPRIRTTLPLSLMALVFTPNTKAQDVRQREALALTIDRRPIQSVLLKGAAEPTASILPNWMTGYSAAFPAQVNVQRAKAVLASSRQPALTLSYDPRDPQAQLIAERIALNARDAGITVQVSLSGPDDVRLVRLVLPSPDPALSLRETARQLSLPAPVLHGNTVEDLYQAEHSLLDGNSVIPLFHIPVASAAGSRVRALTPDPIGAWNLDSAWLEDSR